MVSLGKDRMKQQAGDYTYPEQHHTLSNDIIANNNAASPLNPLLIVLASSQHLHPPQESATQSIRPRKVV